MLTDWKCHSRPITTQSDSRGKYNLCLNPNDFFFYKNRKKSQILYGTTKAYNIQTNLEKEKDEEIIYTGLKIYYTEIITQTLG